MRASSPFGAPRHAVLEEGFRQPFRPVHRASGRDGRHRPLARNATSSWTPTASAAGMPSCAGRARRTSWPTSARATRPRSTTPRSTPIATTPCAPATAINICDVEFVYYLPAPPRRLPPGERRADRHRGGPRGLDDPHRGRLAVRRLDPGRPPRGEAQGDPGDHAQPLQRPPDRHRRPQDSGHPLRALLAGGARLPRAEGPPDEAAGPHRVQAPQPPPRRQGPRRGPERRGADEHQPLDRQPRPGAQDGRPQPGRRQRLQPARQRVDLRAAHPLGHVRPAGHARRPGAGHPPARHQRPQAIPPGRPRPDGRRRQPGGHRDPERDDARGPARPRPPRPRPAPGRAGAEAVPAPVGPRPPRLRVLRPLQRRPTRSAATTTTSSPCPAAASPSPWATSRARGSPRP